MPYNRNVLLAPLILVVCWTSDSSYIIFSSVADARLRMIELTQNRFVLVWAYRFLRSVLPSVDIFTIVIQFDAHHDLASVMIVKPVAVPVSYWNFNDGWFIRRIFLEEWHVFLKARNVAIFVLEGWKFVLY